MGKASRQKKKRKLNRKAPPKPKPKPKPKRKPAKRKRKRADERPRPVPAKRKKRGPKSFLSQKKLPRRAGYETKLRCEVDVNKSNEVVKSYRKGYNLMWKFAPEECERLNFPKPGTFSKYNGHDGSKRNGPRGIADSPLAIRTELTYLQNLATVLGMVKVH